MKVTLNWLKEFVKIDISPEELADKLTNAGFEVEEIEYQNKHLHDVYVCKILSIKKHPNAEKLDICQVDLGDKQLQIITAAKNIREGDYVPVALDGADLVNGVKIKKSNLRGEISEGMFCSGEELGITEDYYKGANVFGILVLNEKHDLGEKIETALGLDDVILDINITPNRPDCMSVIGIAREISAILKTPLISQDPFYEVDENDDVNNYVSVEIKNYDLCPRYMASVVKDIEIKESPMWLKKRINAVGIKCVNNIVDITNYVLVEQGQPMHAFDEKYIEGNKIIIRNAESGEKISVLNGNTYELKPSFNVVADAKKPNVIAGIIGGVNSSVTDSTTISVLEAACFERSNIRSTSRSIGVRTDSTARFEKGVDVGSPVLGMQTALSLVYKLKAGTIVKGIIDVKKYEPKEKVLTFSLKRIFKILGIEVENKDVKDILSHLGLKPEINGDKLTCTVPIFRTDIENDADIAEEIIRLYGYDVYDNLDVPALKDSSYTIGKYNDILSLENKLKLILCDDGYFETLNYTFCPPNANDLVLISPEHKNYNMIKLGNPISDELSCVRTSMAFSMLNSLAYNVKHGNKNLRFFETGRVYLAKELPLTEQPEEVNMLSIGAIDDSIDFFTLKGTIEKLLDSFDFKYDLKYSSLPYLHPGISADVIDKASQEIICSFGKCHPKVCANFELPDKTFYAEINIDKLSKFNEKKVTTKPISKFPYVERDIALIVDEEVTAEKLLSSVKKSAGNLYFSTNIFDIYRSEALGENKKSVAIHVILSSQDKTLTEEEVNQVMNKILKDCEYKFGAKLRWFILIMLAQLNLAKNLLDI